MISGLIILINGNGCSNSGYAVRSVSGKHISMHRVVLGNPAQVDHINRNKLDNREENLRVCNNSLNQANTPKKSNNTSGYKGVSLNKQTGRFTAQITVNWKRMHLGYFDDAYSAAKAYDKQARFHFGDYAEVNFS